MAQPNQNPNPPAEPAVEPAAPAPDTAALQKEVADLKSTMEQGKTEFEGEIAKRDSLLQQYQVALGNAAQQRAPEPPRKEDPEQSTQFEPGTTKYITDIARKEGQRAADEKAAQLVQNADIQTRLGDDKDVLTGAQKEYAALKQNPAFANLPDYAIQAIAVDRAKSSVMEGRSVQLQKELSEAKGDTIDNPNTTGLPPTSPASYQTRKLDPNDPDADLKEWEADPKHIKELRMWTETPNIDPKSTEKIRWFGQEIPINELYRAFAIRAVRKGFNLGGASAMAVRDWQGALGGRQ